VRAFVDTNIFIRLLTGDDPVKTSRCRDLFQQVQHGKVTLVTTSTIVAEVTYVMVSSATYRYPREMIAQRLRPLLALQGLHIEHKDEILSALDLWEATTLDYEDCLAIETTRRLSLDGIYSYDRGFDRVPDIRRLEP
jgi:predicted nucleic acid-binding protein